MTQEKELSEGTKFYSNKHTHYHTSRLSLPSASLSIISKVSSWRRSAWQSKIESFFLFKKLLRPKFEKVMYSILGCVVRELDQVHGAGVCGWNFWRKDYLVVLWLDFSFNFFDFQWKIADTFKTSLKTTVYEEYICSIPSFFPQDFTLPNFLGLCPNVKK